MNWRWNEIRPFEQGCRDIVAFDTQLVEARHFAFHQNLWDDHRGVGL
jgi:hypothetical protein